MLTWALPVMNLGRVFAQGAGEGALPELFAATVPDLPGGSFVGPDGFGQLTGHPTVVGSSRLSHDRELGRALWSLCERQTGTTFDV